MNMRSSIRRGAGRRRRPPYRRRTPLDPAATESLAAESAGNPGTLAVPQRPQPLSPSHVICGALMRRNVPSSISRWISTWSADAPP